MAFSSAEDGRIRRESKNAYRAYYLDEGGVLQYPHPLQQVEIKKAVIECGGEKLTFNYPAQEDMFENTREIMFKMFRVGVQYAQGKVKAALGIYDLED